MASNRPRQNADPETSSRATVRPPPSHREPKFDRLVPSLRSPVSVPLGRLETTVFVRIDGRRSVTEIAQEVGLAPWEVLRILERLMQLVPDLRMQEGEDIVELSMDDLVDDEAKTGENPIEKKK